MVDHNKSRATSRILMCRCPRCYEQLQIHVRGIPQDMSPKEFLAQLEEDDLDFIHHMHVEEASSMISMSRTRTKPITAHPVVTRTKPPTAPPPRAKRSTQRTKAPTEPIATARTRRVTKIRMKPITKP